MPSVLLEFTLIGIERRPRNRAYVALMTFCLASAAVAGDGIFGTKTSPVATTGTDSGMTAMPIAQMFVALLVVLGLLKWLMPFLLKKWNRKAVTTNQGIKVMESAAVGPGSVYVIEVRGRSLLIGATPSSIDCLADLTETPAQAQPLPTFQDMVEEAMPKPMTIQKEAMGDLLGQLERLKAFDLGL